MNPKPLDFPSDRQHEITCHAGRLTRLSILDDANIFELSHVVMLL